MKKLLTLLICLSVQASAQEDTLTLRGAWDMALENNPTEALSLARLAQAEARLKQARATYQPRLDLQASGSRLEYAETQSIRIPGAPESAEQFQVGVELSWLIWDSGSRKNQSEAAGLQVQAAQAGRQNTREQLLADVGRAFASAQLARENLKIAREDMDFQTRQLEDAVRKENAGLNSKADRLNFEIRKRASESVAIREKARYEQAMAVLAALLGIPEEETLPEPAALYAEKPELQVPEANEIWPSVSSRLPDLQEAARRTEAARALLDSRRSDRGPDVSLFGNVTAQREEDPNFAGDDVGNLVGLQVTWNLWDGQIIRSQVEEQMAVLREAEAVEWQLRLQARSRLKQAVANANASLEALDISIESYDLSKENRDLVEASYQAGRATLLRLNEAQRDFNNAGSRLAAARLQLQIDYIDLQRALGTLETFAADWDQ